MKATTSKQLNVSELNLIFYDGTCGLCDRAVQNLLKMDGAGKLHFVMLQEPTAKAFLSSKNIDVEAMESFVYSRKGQLFQKSNAALEVFKDVSFWGKLTYPLMLIPKFIRDGIYNYIAKNRYKWFGQEPSCYLPQPEWSNRFIQDFNWKKTHGS